MKKIIAALIAAIMLISAVCFTSCVHNGGDPETAAPETAAPETKAPETDAPATVVPDGAGVIVENKLETNINAFYISPINNDEWGEPLSEDIPSGARVEVSLSAAPLIPGVASDVGVIDENAVNYDFYVVDLAYGDVLTIEGSREGAVLTVTHSDGTSKQYEAEIYSNDDPDGGKVRCLYLDMDNYSDEIRDEAGERDLIYGTMEYPRLSSSENGEFAALSESLKKSAENGKFSLGQLMLDFEDAARAAAERDGDAFMPFSFTDKAYVLRADSRVLSVTYEFTINAQQAADDRPSYRAVSFDSRTGEILALSDVVTDVVRVRELLEEKLGGAAALEIDPASEDYGLDWFLGSDGLSVIINGEQPRTVLLSFADHPDLFDPEYSKTAENNTSYLPFGMAFEIGVGGKTETVRVSGQEDDYFSIASVTVECGDSSKTVEIEAFDVDPLLIRSDGKTFLYLVMSCMDDYSQLSVFRLDDGADLVNEAGMGWFGAPNEDQDSYYVSLVTDPSFFFMSTRTDVLSTVDGVRLYFTGPSGMPMTGQVLYMLVDRHELTLLRDVKAVKVENGREAGEITLSKGTVLTYCATDGKCLAELTCEDGSMVHIYLDYSQDDGYTVDGVSIIDVFDGMFFAG